MSDDIRESLAAQAAALREAIAKLDEADRLEAEAKRLRGEAAAVTSGKLTLTTDRESATLQPQMLVENAGAGKSQGQMDPAHLEHKFVAMLGKRGLTVRDIGDHLEKKLKRKFPNQTMQAWYRDKDDGYYRPMPEDVAIILKDDFGVPFSAWPRIRRPKSKRA